MFLGIAVVKALFWWSCSQLIVLRTPYSIRNHCLDELGVGCLLSLYLGDRSRRIRNSGHPQLLVEFKARVSYGRLSLLQEGSEEAEEENKQLLQPVIIVV